MIELCRKYAHKLEAQHLADPDDILVGGLDAELVWNRDDARTEILSGIFNHLTINSLVFAKPAEPYRTIIEFLCKRYPESITPEDCETRTFLHDIPICRDFTTEAVSLALSRRKAVIIPGAGIISFGTVTPEQGFVFYSSVCFSCFVLFFSSYLTACQNGGPDEEFREVFSRVSTLLSPVRIDTPELIAGPYNNDDTLLEAMAEAGRAVVDYGLVDSFFGNISALKDGIVWISQTGSSLDELEGCIDPCPQDGSSTAGLTASSELSAHDDVYRRTEAGVILHGHPRFSVIMSMNCSVTNCDKRGECHIKCDRKRDVDGVPVVPGEVGTGPTGLCNTLPPALEDSPAAIVWGHGLFTTAATDFNDAFATLLGVENRCREQYFKAVAACEQQE